MLVLTSELIEGSPGGQELELNMQPEGCFVSLWEATARPPISSHEGLLVTIVCCSNETSKALEAPCAFEVRCGLRSVGVLARLKSSAWHW